MRNISIKNKVAKPIARVCNSSGARIRTAHSKLRSDFSGTDGRSKVFVDKSRYQAMFYIQGHLFSEVSWSTPRCPTVLLPHGAKGVPVSFLILTFFKLVHYGYKPSNEKTVANENLRNNAWICTSYIQGASSAEHGTHRLCRFIPKHMHLEVFGD